MSDRREVDRDQLEKHLDYELKKRGLTRRDLVKGGMGFAAAIGLGGLFAACGGDDDEEAAAPPASPEPAATPEPASPEPTPPAEQFSEPLRVLGLGVGEIAGVIDTAFEAATGYKVTFDLTDSFTMVQRALTQPESFDVFAGYHYQFDPSWGSGNFQSIDRTRITDWDNITPIYKFGKLEPGNANCTTGQGDAPFRLLYTDTTDGPGNIVQWGADDGSGAPEGSEEPPGVTGVPNYFNMDSMGYNSDVIQKEPEEFSWAELFNPEWKGRVAILADPGIGFPDAANAAEAQGLIEFVDKGDMTREEIDGLIKIMLELKKSGQFRAFWADFNESVNLMQSGEVVIESMWSPAVALLQSSGVPVRYAAPIEGFRGWSGGHAIPTHVDRIRPSSRPCTPTSTGGSPASRERSSCARGTTARCRRTRATSSSPSSTSSGSRASRTRSRSRTRSGQETAGIPVGTVRDGGSFVTRACKYTVWNSYFTENEYQVSRWQEVLAA